MTNKLHSTENPVAHQKEQETSAQQTRAAIRSSLEVALLAGMNVLAACIKCDANFRLATSHLLTTGEIL